MRKNVQKVCLAGVSIVGLLIIWNALQRKQKEEKSKPVVIKVISPSSSTDPLQVFKSWMNEYEVISKSRITSKFACLSTIQCNDDNNSNLKCSSRMMSILDITDDFKIIFGTILSSNKVKEMRMNNNVNLTFNYNETRTSIRINGIVNRCDAKITDKYWKSRGKSYKIWSMATTQYKEIENIKEFEERINKTAEEYNNVNKEDIELPTEKWGTFEIIPLEIEFWRYGSNNLHLRHRYFKEKDAWNCVMFDS